VFILTFDRGRNIVALREGLDAAQVESLEHPRTAAITFYEAHWLLLSEQFVLWCVV
jgi:hypothetical protein